MKLRTDYVSNSSSSSFIIADNEMFDHFNIGKEELIDALKELNGGRTLDFVVYDMHDEKDKAECEEELKPILNDFDATNAWYDFQFDKLTINDNRHYKWWNDFIEILKYTYNLWCCSPTDINNKLTISEYSFDKKKNCMTSKCKKAPSWLVKIIVNTRKKLGVLTNWEAANCKESRYVVHFSDNAINGLKGLHTHGKNEEMPVIHKDPTGYLQETLEEIKNSPYETYCYSMERICELIMNQLVESGKINPEDKFFSDIDRKYLYCRLGFSMVSCCMHEG